MISFHSGKTLSEQKYNGNGICIAPARKWIHAGDQIEVTARNGELVRVKE
jgi:membrane-bound ClpP family serine protease